MNSASRFFTAAGLCAVLLCQRTEPAAAARPASLQLNRGDHICLIGNTLCDRMQHHGWLETVLQHRFADHQLVFRNLGFPADEIAHRPRSENFGSPDEWLTRTEADVVFAFFGYNEAFAGRKGIRDFRDQLAKWIDHTLKQKYNGQSAPQIVLFSPITHEDLHSPHLPDGSENNARLALYTQAMLEVAAEKGVVAVDLFRPTAELYASSKEPLTINGIHLTPEGNRHLAELIDRTLFGDPQSTDRARLESIRQAVLDKNFHWWNRYRTVDGYNVFGGRSKLEWHGQSNYDVMQREMKIFDVMTANRDQRIWAVAQGRDLQVDDSNTPELLQVKTNKPGPLEGGAYPFLGGEEAIDTMHVADGMQVNLFASEEQFPDLANPVQMSVGPDSRLWVATWPTYPHWNPKETLKDKIVILPDEDGDGRADELIVFADGLNSVTGFEFWGGGVLVAAAPELLLLKDTDGDDRADVKIHMLHGVSSADTHHTANSLLIGPDGGLYFSHGIFHVDNMETPTKTFRSTASGVFRFDPRTFEVGFHFPIGPNPHGNVIDQWGYQFANDGTSGTGSYVSIGHGVGAPKQWFKKRVRPVAATGILSSSHFPERNNGNFLICNTIGFLGVLQHRVEYDGADINAIEIEPIVYAEHPNFRPTDVEIGGDGALYISDWCNPLIGHMQHNIRDPNRDHLHGRVYRVTAKDRPLLQPAKMRGQPIERILAHFYAPENGTRYRARLELSGRKTHDVTAAVADWAATIQPDRPADEQALLEALWVFEEHRVANEGLLRKVLRAKEPRVRAAAIRTLGHWGTKIESWQPLLLAAARDSEPLVRAEAVKAAVAFDRVAASEGVFEASVRPTDVQLDFVIDYAGKKLELVRLVQEAIRSGKPLSTPAHEYALKHADADDLLKLKPSSAIYEAILGRGQVAAPPLRAALAGLAKLRQTDQLALLLDLIERRDADPSSGSAETFRGLLLQQSVEELGTVRDRLVRLATHGKSAAARQAGFAAWITADGSADEAFVRAAQDKQSLGDWLAAVALVPSDPVRATAYPRVRPLLFALPDNLASQQGDAAGDKAAGESLHDRAIQTLSSIPGHPTEDFIDLARLIRTGRHRAAAIEAIRAIPEEHWSDGQVRPLADNLVAYVSEIPAKKRTSKPATAAIELARQLAKRLPASEASEIQTRLTDLDVHVVAIGTVPHRMIYDKERIVVQAGEAIEFRFSNSDNMPHNFAIVQPGGLKEVGELAEATARDPDAMERQYLPKSDRILLGSDLLQPGQSQSLSFEAPATPGVYPYVCTYPGHWRRMFGALYVVPNLEEYQANPAAYLASQSLPVKDELLETIGRDTEWKFDDVVADVRALPHGRSFVVGQQLFKAANCVACHKMNGDGFEFGPDLTKIDAKNKPEDILRSMLEPSHKIDEKYQSYVFQLDSGKVVTGMILGESPDAIQVIDNPIAKPEPIELRRDEVVAQKKSTKSIMPEGQLSRLRRDDILDLVAYIYARGDKDHELFETHDGH